MNIEASSSTETFFFNGFCKTGRCTVKKNVRRLHRLKPEVN
jgi:hypothetical protein